MIELIKEIRFQKGDEVNRLFLIRLPLLSLLNHSIPGLEVHINSLIRRCYIPE